MIVQLVTVHEGKKVVISDTYAHNSRDLMLADKFILAKTPLAIAARNVMFGLLCLTFLFCNSVALSENEQTNIKAQETQSSAILPYTIEPDSMETHATYPPQSSIDPQAPTNIELLYETEAMLKKNLESSKQETTPQIKEHPTLAEPDLLEETFTQNILVVNGTRSLPQSSNTTTSSSSTSTYDITNATTKDPQQVDESAQDTTPKESLEIEEPKESARFDPVPEDIERDTTITIPKEQENSKSLDTQAICTPAQLEIEVNNLSDRLTIGSDSDLTQFKIEQTKCISKQTCAWVQSTTGIAKPNPLSAEFEGTALARLQDLTGSNFILELIDKIKKDSHGWVITSIPSTKTVKQSSASTYGKLVLVGQVETIIACTLLNNYNEE